MAEGEPPSRGVLQSLRGLTDSILALLQNRLELFGVEIQEQKERLLRVLIWTAVVVFLGNMTAILLTLTIVVLAGEKARGPVLIGLTLVYLAGAIAAILALRKEMRSVPPALSETIAEIKKDRDWLKPPN
jgi:uncharacterized membrane protein YqjE